MEDRAGSVKELAKSSALVIFSSAIVFGCPVCHTATGEQVRAGIFNSNFLSIAFATFLPFPLLLGIVALIYFPLPGASKRDGDKG